MDEILKTLPIICSGLFGALLSFVTGLLLNKRNEILKIRNSTSILYYDLLSLEDYLKSKDFKVNIRYSDSWQGMIAECTF